jgi:hypothetical protein
VFANNSNGQRGDMAAVIRAILSDAEARDSRQLNSSTSVFGKVREPMLKLSTFFRATGASSQDGRYRIWYTEDSIGGLSQNFLTSPTVFNFFSPSFALSSFPTGLVAPELQLVNEATITASTNFFNRIQSEYREGGVPAEHTKKIIRPKYEGWVKYSQDPAELVRQLDTLLLYGTMNSETRAAIIDAVSSISLLGTGATERVQAAFFLILASPDFAIQR